MKPSKANFTLFSLTAFEHAINTRKGSNPIQASKNSSIKELDHYLAAEIAEDLRSNPQLSQTPEEQAIQKRLSSNPARIAELVAILNNPSLRKHLLNAKTSLVCDSAEDIPDLKNSLKNLPQTPKPAPKSAKMDIYFGSATVAEARFIERHYGSFLDELKGIYSISDLPDLIEKEKKLEDFKPDFRSMAFR